MSRSIANIATGLVRTLTAPLSARQRKRTIARVIDNLQQGNLAQVATHRGTIYFYALRSAYAASAVERFHTDEPETLKWIDGFAADATLWDVGASIGVYSLYAALDASTSVLAFEPSGFNFGLLVDHIAVNKLGDRIKPFCIALGERSSMNVLHMHYAASGTGGNALEVPSNQLREFSPTFSQAVLAYTIDDFRHRYALDAPDHIKLDVDGIEPQILAGAAATLPLVKSILIEVEGRNEDDVRALIERPLQAAGLSESLEFRNFGSGRNRLYTRTRV